jgi:hypothetical protein
MAVKPLKSFTVTHPECAYLLCSKYVYFCRLRLSDVSMVSDSEIVIERNFGCWKMQYVYIDFVVGQNVVFSCVQLLRNI